MTEKKNDLFGSGDDDESMPVFEYFKIYRSKRLMAALNLLRQNIRYVQHRRSNSPSDFTCFEFNYEHVEPEQEIILESFLCYFLRYRNILNKNASSSSSSTKKKAKFDLYEGEWSLILYLYWELCTQDLRCYDEHVVRIEEKRLLGYLLFQIYKSVKAEECTPSKTFKLHVVNNAIHKLQLDNKRFVPLNFVEYVKHYLSVFSNNIASSNGLLWSLVFKRLDIHHASCSYTFEKIMSRRADVLANVLRIFGESQVATDEHHHEVKFNRFSVPWTRCSNFVFVSALTHQTVKLQKPQSQLFRMTSKHISKPQVNYLFGSIFDDHNDVSDRLKYEVETMYQFFVDQIAQYVIKTNCQFPLDDRNTVKFFESRLYPLRRRYVDIKCLTSIGVPDSLRHLVVLSLIETLLNHSPVFGKVLKSKAGIAKGESYSNSAIYCANDKDDWFVTVDFQCLFFTIINESLTYACAPLLAQYDAKSLTAFEWNTQLCACFDEFCDMVIKSFDFVNGLPTWYVSSAIINVDYDLKILQRFKLNPSAL